MALTLTKASATPSSLKYTFSGTGTVQTDKTITQLLADCAAGPLKNLLAQVNAGLNAGISGLTWTNIANSGLLSVYISVQNSSGTAQANIMSFFNPGSPNLFSTLCAFGGDNVNGVIELRYHHSVVR